MDLKITLLDLIDAQTREHWRQERKAAARQSPKALWADYHARKAGELETIAERLRRARIIEGDER
jgi:hypothetical protein